MKELVALGGRHTILPLYAVQQEVKKRVLRATPIVAPEIFRTILMAVSTQRPMSRATIEVAGIIRQIVKELRSRGSLAGVSFASSTIGRKPNRADAAYRRRRTARDPDNTAK